VNVGWSQYLSIPRGVAAVGNTIGGTGGVNSTLNVISGNTAGPMRAPTDGIDVVGGGVQDTLIEGNYIGIGVDGTTALGNSGNGIYVGTDGFNPPTNITIGGTVSGAGNVISANSGYGVLVNGSAGSNSLLNNTIGYNANGEDPSPDHIMKNREGEVNPDTLGNTWTVEGNLEQ
jgi:hypothetical protein